MPKGGARSSSGPPPDPDALRRQRPSDQAGWTTLPAEGRKADPPEWPLATQADREVDLWRDVWTRPQAFMWERQNQVHEVAMFVRTLFLAEQPDASIERHKLLRQYFDGLGLSAQGLLRNRWKIAATPDEGDAPAPKRKASSKARLTVVANEGD